MPFIIVILFIIACAFLFWAANKAANNDYDFIEAVCLTSAVCMIVMIIFATANAFFYGSYLANTEAYNAQAIEERVVYEEMLNRIPNLIEQDVTASNSYLEIYNKVIDFNMQVNKANKWTDTWAEGILCDPRYKGLEIIPLN